TRLQRVDASVPYGGDARLTCRVRPIHATMGRSSIGASRTEYNGPLPLELMTDATQSAHSPPNGRHSTRNTPSPTHQARSRTPNAANGNRLGFSNANGAAQRYTIATDIAAAAQITGLPVQIFSGVVGQARQRAMSGQTAGRGRTRAIAQT